MTMAAKILDGKILAQKTKERIACEAKELSSKPGLAVILVGDDPASRVYVTSKRKDCQECGFYSEEYTLPADARPEQLLELIDVLNGREEIDGILVQLPLPSQFDEGEVLMAIDPAKDVDCFHPVNVGRLMTGDARFLPCTPAGVMALLEEGGIDPAGKHCVVLGRSNIVGKPQAILLLQKDATVTICHSKTPDLAQECRRADILVSAVGRTGLVTPDMVRDGAVVVDVAMNRDENGKLCGDCCREVYEKSSAYTPVPGGVGPMTRAMLMENTLRAAKLRGK
jgi:methylenetetrahydrofolate dehydrogenase (NADP+)/methenyltetrahydrofolate cyclohydrolase